MIYNLISKSIVVFIVLLYRMATAAATSCRRMLQASMCRSTVCPNKSIPFTVSVKLTSIYEHNTSMEYNISEVATFSLMIPGY